MSASLRAAGWHITIETSGTLYLPVACDLMSISPKLSNSTPPPERDPQWTWRHTLQRHAPEVIRRLTAEYDYQLKFVVDCPDDCREVEAYLAEFPEIERGRVMLMPQGIEAADALAEKAAWLEPYLHRARLPVLPPAADRMVRRRNGERKDKKRFQYLSPLPLGEGQGVRAEQWSVRSRKRL